MERFKASYTIDYFRLLENYKETEWSSTSGLEDHYKQLEASYATEFGDHEEALGKAIYGRLPTSSGSHGKPGKSPKKFHACKNHGI